MSYFLRRFFVFAFIALGFASAAHAHDAGLSVVEVRPRADKLELTGTFALSDVQRLLPSVHLGTDTSSGTIDAARTELNQLGELLWDVRADGRPLPPLDLTIDFSPTDNLAFHLTYARPAGAQVVIRATDLAALPATHREMFSLVDEQGHVRAERTLSAADSAVQVSLLDYTAGPDTGEGSGSAISPTSASAGGRFAAFFKLGVEHIWTGYDHLLFLLGLLLVCRSFKSIAVIITCFTVAHSITLALAGLGFVTLSPRLVEPLIAASIAFVGMENLLRRGAEPRGRGWLTFGFGLIHGFGFASALTELGVGHHGEGIALPLLAFNLGVEAGQLSVAAIVLPLLLRGLRSEKVRSRFVPIASGVVAVLGFYWLIERVFFD